MTPLVFALTLFGISAVAGFLGALLGMGGGLLLVPLLTVGLGVDIRYAIGASIVSVIATSSGAAVGYARERLTNLRVATFLELATVAGALGGAVLAGHLRARWLYLLFGLVIGYSALLSLRRARGPLHLGGAPDALADRLALHGSYQEGAHAAPVGYRVSGTLPGLGLMFVAGTASGLLGIGSGALKVLALDSAMRLPLKVSTATSNFMIGVTAAASAGVYFARGEIDPFIAGPVATGVVLGAFAGGRRLSRLQPALLRKLFVGVLLLAAAQMAWRGLA